MAIDIGRRQFIFALGRAAAAWPLAARAQQGECMRRIGVLGGTAADDPQNQARMGAFVQGLQQLGWIDGRSVRIDTRWPAGDAADTRKYAAELVALSPDGSRATNLRRPLHVGFSRKRPSAAASHRAALGESQTRRPTQNRRKVETVTCSICAR
jgi:hypothetical protein